MYVYNSEYHLMKNNSHWGQLKAKVAHGMWGAPKRYAGVLPSALLNLFPLPSSPPLLLLGMYINPHTWFVGVVLKGGWKWAVALLLWWPPLCWGNCYPPLSLPFIAPTLLNYCQMFQEAKTLIMTKGKLIIYNISKKSISILYHFFPREL